MTLEEIKQTIADFRLFAHRHLKIKDKDGNIVPFVLNKAQQIVLSAIEEMIQAGLPVRMIILKARQKGISTLIEAYIFWRTTYQPNRKSAVIGHVRDATDNLWDMTNRYYDNLPEYFQPEKKYHNSKELTYSKTKSEMIFWTAETGDVGSSHTVQDLHITELSKWRDPKTTLTSLLQTVPDKPNTMIIMESTANGFGGEFYNRCKAAMAGKSKYKFIFLSWLIDDEYTLPFTDQKELDAFKANIDEIEQDLLSKGATYEHLKWRREIGLPDKCGHDVDKFKQEYPSDPIEAFVTSGRPVFDAKICQKKYIELENRKPLKVGDLELVNDKKVEFTENPDGYIKLYKEIQVEDNEHYVYAIGCLPDGEKVVTENGEENIQDVELNSRLLDADGDYVEIINKQRRPYKGRLVEIKPFLTIGGTKFTAEHPILVLKDNKIHSHSNTKNHTHKNRRYRFYHKEVIYKPAGEITEKDILRFPLPKSQPLSNDEIKKHYKYSGGKGNISHDADSILKKEFWFMVGLWLAEGYALKGVSRGHDVCYCLSTQEKELREQIVINAKYLFNRSVCQRVRGNSCELKFSNKDFAIFLTNNFGKYADKKMLPNWVKQLPENLLAELFRGYFNGDGCLIKEKDNRERINCVSVSGKLLNDFQDILLSLRIISSVKILRKEKQTKIRGKIISQKKTYELNLSSRDTDLYWKLIGAEITNKYTREKHKGYAWVEGDYIYIKIHRLTRTYFEGYVNNFETKTHSYCARFIASHNCDVAEGLEQGDYSVIRVLDRRTKEVVLVWHGHIDADLLAHEQKKISMYLKNKCFIGTEFNNHGQTTVYEAYKLNLNQYYREDFSTGKEIEKHQLGFKTTIATKPFIINDLKEWIREGLLKDYEVEFWDECLTFVRNARGAMGAQDKDKDPSTQCFDDRVMSAAIMIKVHSWMPKYYKDAPKEKDWDKPARKGHLAVKTQVGEYTF